MKNKFYNIILLMKLSNLLVLSALIFCTSCLENKSNKENVSFEEQRNSEIEKQKEQEEKSFNDKLQNASKIFLKYWEGMTYEEYNKVSKLLMEEGVIEEHTYTVYKYKVGDCNVHITPIFKNDLIYGIKLSNDIECIYPLYKEKYNLPDLVEKSTTKEFYRENNPYYSPRYTFSVGNKIYNLPDCFNDNSFFVEGKSRVNLEDDNLHKEKFLVRDSLIIDNNYTVIKFKQFYYDFNSNIPDNRKSDFYTYSLQENLSNFIKCTDYFDEIGVYGISAGKVINECVKTNSKTRVWRRVVTPVITIEYLSKKEYNKEVEKERNKMQTIQNKKIDNAKRTQEAYDEI